MKVSVRWLLFVWSVVNIVVSLVSEVVISCDVGSWLFSCVISVLVVMLFILNIIKVVDICVGDVLKCWCSSRVMSL